MSLRLGSGLAVRRFRRRLLEVWAVFVAAGVLAGWLFAKLPALLAVPLLALVVLGVLVATVICAVVLGLLRRARVAAGQGWVGLRLLGRWRVFEHRRIPGGWSFQSAPGTTAAPAGVDDTGIDQTPVDAPEVAELPAVPGLAELPAAPGDPPGELPL